MKNISNKQSTTAIAVMGAAALFGMLSFGNSAQAATYSSACQTFSGILGPCCDRMMGSQLINVYGDCHSRKVVLKRKLVRPPVIVRLLPLESEREGGGGNGGNGGGDKGKGPRTLR